MITQEAAADLKQWSSVGYLINLFPLPKSNLATFLFHALYQVKQQVLDDFSSRRCLVMSITSKLRFPFLFLSFLEPLTASDLVEVTSTGPRFRVAYQVLQSCRWMNVIFNVVDD